MPGSVQLGPSDGRVILRTYREGLAAQVGHDLVLQITEWSATVTPPGVEGGPAIEARLDLSSLRVLEGTGGVKPLTDKDRRDIVGNASKSLHSVQPERRRWNVRGHAEPARRRPAGGPHRRPNGAERVSGHGDGDADRTRHQAVFRLLRNAQAARHRRSRGRDHRTDPGALMRADILRSVELQVTARNRGVK